MIVGLDSSIWFLIHYYNNNNNNFYKTTQRRKSDLTTNIQCTSETFLVLLKMLHLSKNGIIHDYLSSIHYQLIDLLFIALVYVFIDDASAIVSSILTILLTIILHCITYLIISIMILIIII